MKTFLFLFLLLFLCLCPYFAGAQTLFPFKLKKEAKLYKRRKVKTIKTYSSFSAKEKTLSKTETFNKKGQIMKMERFGSKRNLRTIYLYNDKGCLIRQARTSKDGKFNASVDYDYKDGKLIHEKHNVTPQAYTITYHYDSNRHIDSSFISSTESQRDVWHYNKKGKVTAVLGYNTQDYDTDGNWIQEYKELFYYDEDNGLLTKNISCFGHLCYIDEHHYNKKKQKIETLEYEGDNLMGKTNYEYSKKGLLLKVEFTAQENEYETHSTTTFEYTYH